MVEEKSAQVQPVPCIQHFMKFLVFPGSDTLPFQAFEVIEKPVVGIGAHPGICSSTCSKKSGFVSVGHGTCPASDKHFEKKDAMTCSTLMSSGNMGTIM
jgi:hypothetical protein